MYKGVIILLLLLSCETEEHCWDCTTIWTYKMTWKQYDDSAKPSVFTSETQFSICDMTEENILILERTSSDSTWWSSGYIYNEVSKRTTCETGLPEN